MLGSAPKHRQGVAAGTIAPAPTTGMVLGVAIAGSVYAAALASPDTSGPAGAYAHALVPAVIASLGAALTSLFKPHKPPAAPPSA